MKFAAGFFVFVVPAAAVILALVGYIEIAAVLLAVSIALQVIEYVHRRFAKSKRQALRVDHSRRRGRHGGRGSPA